MDPSLNSGFGPPGSGQTANHFPIFNPCAPSNLRQDATGLRAMSANAQKVTAGLGLPTHYGRPGGATSSSAHGSNISGSGNGHGCSTAPLPTVSGSPLYQTEFTKRKNWHHRIVSEITDMVHVISPSGKIMFCSPSSVEVVGYTPEELIGRSITDFIHVDDVDTYIREFNMAIIQRDFRLFYRFRRKDDRFVLLEVVGHPWFTADSGTSLLGSTTQGTGQPPSSIPDAGLGSSSFNLNLNAQAAQISVNNPGQGHGALARYPGGVYSTTVTSNDGRTPYMVSHGNNDAMTSNLSLQSGSSGSSESSGSMGQVSAGSGLAGFPVAKCFFSIARPYPIKSTSFLDNLLELKMENELLVRQFQQMGGDEDILLQITSSMNDEFELSHLRNRLMANRPEYMAGISDHLDISSTTLSSLASSSKAMSDLSGMQMDSSAGNLGSGMTMGMGMVGNMGPTMVRRKKRRTKTEALEHVCTDCGTVESPEWRKGPQGPKTLCNACGLRWAKKNKKIDLPLDALVHSSGLASAGSNAPGSITGSSVSGGLRSAPSLAVAAWFPDDEF
ncbi:hypothetical protein H4R33_003970 [Dimargaris cristalligena]|uniref:Uncharacterized protein n=1 Tax=Dimargaris cristalligena TaxID=215637 RepID=A0A4V1J5M9_9FUNG|nr:hypothetical protein H4R33_003970 [Dimargaris cristalligena]RKP39619.1 hypothetical protein BJ085DRAFT_37961 [Dimargaris cristalligena]|eukprot:RKP39619.1 hypothetical protein BJ085DRAFT_37961 [Dimargaris cristalligena]